MRGWGGGVATPFVCLGLSAATWRPSASEHTQNAVSQKDDGFAALLLAQDLNPSHLLFAKQLNYFGPVNISRTTPDLNAGLEL